MQEATYTHVAFADESNWNHGRFRSLSLVSATVKNARALHRELDIIRQEHNAKEFKWTNTKWRHGIALADFFFQRCDRMRVDVLIWDIEDSRHKNVYRRDDKANFARMYYHLLHNVLKKRWSDGACWRIYPDEQKEVDWLKLEECLGWQSWAFEENLFTRMDPASGLRQFYDINEFSCVSSIKFLLIQLADMFAGLAAYSYSAFDKYQQWKRDQDTAPDLFDSDGVSIEKLTFSKSDKERLPVLHHVREEAGRRNFQVSLDSSNGLSTKNPAKPLNFWLYIPQRPTDKAPVKPVRRYSS